MLLHQFGDRQPVFVRHHRARRIAREVEHQQLGARGDNLLQRFGRQLKALLRPGLNLYQCAPVQVGNRGVGDIAG
ncbi:hypothetical protein D3C80_1654830 [compost metagenome]